MADRCILFADVVGSTLLYEKLGDAEAKRAVERCLKRVTLAVEHFGGRQVKTVGDGLLADFSDASAALAAACEMQQRVEDLPRVAGNKLALRVGFHGGAVIEEGGDVFGDSVNLASRLAALARPGQVIMSATTAQGLTELARQSVRDLPPMVVKGKADAVSVCEVIWNDADGLTLVSGQPDATQTPAGEKIAKLILRYGEHLRDLDITGSSLTIGRELDCDLVVADPRASRHHATVERRGDKYVLIDQSTNGTWLARDGEAEVKLSREEAPLIGRGRISLGHPQSPAVESVVFLVQ